jgi:membrane associated rhomboid family serine protease
MSLLDELKTSFQSGNVVIKLVFANSIVFLVFALINAFAFLLDAPMLGGVMQWLMLPGKFFVFIKQPWSLITYMFLHSGFFHLLFNMLWLYWMGMLLDEYLGKKRVLEAYFLGAITGGVLFIAAYSLLPVFADRSAFAVGSSAGVLSVVCAAATLLPNYGVQLVFLGEIRLKWIALACILIDLISIPGSNAGGHIAHLGGAAFGFFYVRSLYSNNFLLNGMRNIFRTKSKLKVHHGPGNFPSDDDVDRILDKIARTGYDSLSKKEKDTLFRASKK